jgi:hypothetical protein
MCEIRIGGEEYEYLSIHVIGRELSEGGLADYWECNWLTVLVEVCAGAFRASVRCQFQAEDLVHLRCSLQDLLDRKDDTADFSTLEGWLAAHLMMDERGRINLVGDLIDRPMDGNRLRFQLALDQSFLASILRELDRAIERFPVIGTPPLPQ